MTDLHREWLDDQLHELEADLGPRLERMFDAVDGVSRPVPDVHLADDADHHVLTVSDAVADERRRRPARWLVASAAVTVLVVALAVLERTRADAPSTASTVAAPDAEAAAREAEVRAAAEQALRREAEAARLADETIPPLTRTLREGDRGDDVAMLEAQLGYLGFHPGPADGVFDGLTTQAVWAFETLSLGHPVAASTGEVHPDWWPVLFEGGRLEPQRPQPAGATHVEIYLPEQALAVFVDNQPALIAHISSGAFDAAGRPLEFCSEGEWDLTVDGEPLRTGGQVCAAAITPGGVFAVTHELSGEFASPLDVMTNPVFFNMGIAVAGSSVVPLEPASHGTVRIAEDLSTALAEFVEQGDLVYVWNGVDEPEDVSERDSLPSFFRGPDPVEGAPDGDVLIGSSDFGGQVIGVSIVDHGTGICRTIAGGERGGCDTVDLAGGPLHAFGAGGGVVWGVVAGHLTISAERQDDLPPQAFFVGEPVEYAGASYRAFVVRYGKPDPDTVLHVSVSAVEPSSDGEPVIPVATRQLDL